jgi:hypothetical protein
LWLVCFLFTSAAQKICTVANKHTETPWRVTGQWQSLKISNMNNFETPSKNMFAKFATDSGFLIGVFLQRHSDNICWNEPVYGMQSDRGRKNQICVGARVASNAEGSHLLSAMFGWDKHVTDADSVTLFVE